MTPLVDAASLLTPRRRRSPSSRSRCWPRRRGRRCSPPRRWSSRPTPRPRPPRDSRRPPSGSPPQLTGRPGPPGGCFPSRPSSATSPACVATRARSGSWCPALPLPSGASRSPRRFRQPTGRQSTGCRGHPDRRRARAGRAAPAAAATWARRLSPAMASSDTEHPEYSTL